MRKNIEELMSSRVAKLTKWQLINVIQFSEILKKEYGPDLSKIEDQTCALCCCDLYEGIQTMSQEDIDKIGNEQIGLLRGVDVVLMSHCKAHFFHAECLTHQLGDKAFIKCAICSHQYGKETGNMPNGTMTIHLNN